MSILQVNDRHFLNLAHVVTADYEHSCRRLDLWCMDGTARIYHGDDADAVMAGLAAVSLEIPPPETIPIPGYVRQTL